MSCVAFGLRSLFVFLCLLAVSVSLAPGALAQQGKTLAILMPGAGGAVSTDFLIRNRGRISGAGLDTQVATSAEQAASIARTEAAKGRKVVVVGMSQGGNMAGQVVAAGAPLAGVVFVAAPLRLVAGTIGAPAKMPAALVVHHRQDGCQRTLPEGVGYFQKWGGGKVSVRWINTTGKEAPNPCGPRGAHGFYMQDGQAVSAIIEFVRAR